MWEEIGTFDNTLGFHQPITQNILNLNIFQEQCFAFWGCYRILFPSAINKNIIDAINAKFFIVDNVSECEIIILAPFFHKLVP